MHLVRPGVGMMGMDTYCTPKYPFRYTVPKVGDKIFVILEDDENMWIASDTIAEVSDYYLYAVESYNHQKGLFDGSILWQPEWGEKPDRFEEPKPVHAAEGYLIDFWPSKYVFGHAHTFGDTLYSSFEEAKFVLLQYYVDDLEQFHEILKASEAELGASPEKEDN